MEVLAETGATLTDPRGAASERPVPTAPEARVTGAAAPGGDRRAAALVVRARAGDRAAFGELYADHAALVHAVLLGMVAVREAEDMVHDVFLAALARLGQLEEPGRFGPWIAAIARNRARDLLRARHRVPARLADVDEPADTRGRTDEAGGLAERDGAPGEHVARAAEDEEAERALAALRALPVAYRETLALRFVEGLDGREIALRTGLTYGSVRVNLCRGMKLLRERLADAGVAVPVNRRAEPRGGGGAR